MLDRLRARLIELDDLLIQLELAETKAEIDTQIAVRFGKEMPLTGLAMMRDGMKQVRHHHGAPHPRAMSHHTT